MKYFVKHPSGIARAVRLCIEQQMPFILDSQKAIELVMPSRQGINALIAASAKVTKASRNGETQLECQPDEEEGASMPPPASSVPCRYAAPHGMSIFTRRLVNWLHRRIG